MKNGGENDQSASFVYKGQYFWYLQTKRHCFTQTNSEINGDFKGKECICSMQLAGIFTTHFTYSLFLSAATELMHTGPWRALETYMPQIWKECGGAAAHKATASSCRAISDQACYFYILNDKFKKRSKMAKYQKCQELIPDTLTKFPLSQHTAPGCHSLDPHILVFPFLQLYFHPGVCAAQRQKVRKKN